MNNASDLQEEQDALVGGGELQAVWQIHRPNIYVFPCVVEQISFIQILKMSAQNNIFIYNEVWGMYQLDEIWFT